MGTINVDTIKNNVGGNTGIKIGDAPLSSSSGNLGLGTDAPGELLHLKTTADSDLGIKVENDDTQAFCKVQSTGNALYGGNGGVNFISGGSFATAMNIDSNGHITKPLQPAFLVHASGSQNDMTAGSTATVVLSTEVYDQNNDFASNTFTAPVDGKYFLVFTVLFTDVQTECTEIEIRINTSNRIYRLFIVPSKQLSADGSIGDSFSVVADMDASDTAIIQVTPSGGSDEMNIHHYTFFSGCLLA